MTTLADIHAAYSEAQNYPELVKKLVTLGIRSYTVDVATETMLYRLAEGNHLVHRQNTALRHISDLYNEAATIQAVRDTQQGKTDYPTFLDDIAKAGIRLYEATLEGPRKRVTYIGAGGYYEEEIPF